MLLDALPQVPGWRHALILTGFALAFLWLLWGGPRAIRLPRRQSAIWRLERANDPSHRLLQALADNLAAGADDRDSEELWRHHRRRMAAIFQLKTGSTPTTSRSLTRAPSSVPSAFATDYAGALASATCRASNSTISNGYFGGSNRNEAQVILQVRLNHTCSGESGFPL